ncbi:10020_t:CDS:2, partial [Funneliformis caledonium]
EVVLERIGHFGKYFPELVSLSESLENYSFCERYYNQIIATNHLLKHLKTLDIPIVNDKQAVSEIRIQVSLSHPDMNILLLQLSQNKADLSAFRSQWLQDIKYINEC